MIKPSDTKLSGQTSYTHTHTHTHTDTHKTNTLAQNTHTQKKFEVAVIKLKLPSFVHFVCLIDPTDCVCHPYRPSPPPPPPTPQPATLLTIQCAFFISPFLIEINPNIFPLFSHTHTIHCGVWNSAVV